MSVLSCSSSCCGFLIFFPDFQFVVLRDGCWQKINYKSNDSFLDSTADSHVVLDSPWICHFTSASKRRCVRSAGTHEHGVPCDEEIHLKGNVPSGSSRGLEQHSLCHQRQQDLIGNTTGNFDYVFAFPALPILACLL